ncbi:MAG: hypothetical protein RIC29_13885 [Rhodospirillaceae bacterium]
MPQSEVEIIISIKPPHVTNILSSKKKFELRRRPLNVPIGTLIWIYSTLPSGRFAASARLIALHVGTPGSLRHLAKDACVTSKEYDEYYCGASQACALELGDVTEIPPGAELRQIREKIDESFHPPQFFQKTFNGSAIPNFLRSHIDKAA